LLVRRLNLLAAQPLSSPLQTPTQAEYRDVEPDVGAAVGAGSRTPDVGFDVVRYMEPNLARALISTWEVIRGKYVYCSTWHGAPLASEVRLSTCLISRSDHSHCRLVVVSRQQQSETSRNLHDRSHQETYPRTHNEYCI